MEILTEQDSGAGGGEGEIAGEGGDSEGCGTDEDCGERCGGKGGREIEVR